MGTYEERLTQRDESEGPVGAAAEEPTASPANGVDGFVDDPASVAKLRQALWHNGYRPVAVWSPGALVGGQPVAGAGKRPVSRNWRGLALHNPPDAVQRPAWAKALNTGVVTGEVITPDVDVLVPAVAEAIVSMIEGFVTLTGRARTARRVKVAAWLRSAIAAIVFRPRSSSTR